VTVRVAALDAIAEASVGALAGQLEPLIAPTRATDIRIAAMRASAAIGNHGVAYALGAQLPADLTVDRELARVEVDTLVTLDAEQATADTLRVALAKKPAPIALYAAGGVAVPALAKRIATWSRTGDVRVRAAACAALESVADRIAWPALPRGIRDRDASVRASCLDAVSRRVDISLVGEESERSKLRGSGRIPTGAARAALVRTLRETTRDRDASVRAAALGALGHLGSSSQLVGDAIDTVPDLSADKVPAVRAAYARAVENVSLMRPTEGGRDRVLPLLDDGDPEVRAAAWSAFLVLLRRPFDRIEADPPPADLSERLARALKDPSPHVRRAALEAVDDDAVLLRLAADDDDGEVRTRALVRFASRARRSGAADVLLRKIAASQAGTTDRVRAALAWHLAR
jgi:HEAT repeat protein